MHGSIQKRSLLFLQSSKSLWPDACISIDAFPFVSQSSGSFDLKEPYYRQLTTAGWWGQTAAADAQVNGRSDQVNQIR